MAQSEWPKKMPAGDYAKRWYTSRTKQSVINDINRGHLPGVQEPGGQWFVWVNADDTPAQNYRVPISPSTNVNTIAQAILAKRGLLKLV